MPEPILASDPGAAEDFRPPFPARPSRPYPIADTIRLWRKNTIAIFMDRDFSRRLHRRKVLGREIFLCLDPDFVREALIQRHETFQRKTPQMRHSLAPLLGDGLFVSDSATWRLRRSIVAPIVHGRRMAAFAPTICETALEWRDSWRQRPSDVPVNVLGEMGELTAEIISRTIFGRRLGRQFTGEVVAGFADYQRHIDQIDLRWLLGLPDWLPRWRGLRVQRALRRVHRVLDDVIDRLAGQEGDEDAVITSLFQARDEDGEPLTREAIRNEAIVIFMAGHETTANTLAWAWYMISQSKRVRETLHAELDQVLGGRAPTLADMPKLVYTRAIVEETLRLYPPVPILGREAMQDDTIDGWPVPKGSLVLVVPWLMHRNPELWSQPDHFVPERFDPRVSPRPEKNLYIPFATGPRICPGMVFGLTEAVICLATLGQEFDPVLAPGHEVEIECRLTLRPGATLPMLLRRRGPAA
ncbi:MAG: cytochrome P450 [Pseudomonadota bacterium]